MTSGEAAVAAQVPAQLDTLASLEMPWVPRLCVWELTLECNCRCLHCGSSAGAARARELDTKEALTLVAELGQLGCECITLSGGEPLLRRDWPTLAASIRHHGMQVELVTNGLRVVEQADAIRDAGFASVTFSVDGPAAVHDTLRGSPGCLSSVLLGAAALGERGVKCAAVTQINQI